MESSEFTTSIPRRTPLLNSETAKTFLPPEIDHQWNLITGAIRKDLMKDPHVREKLIEFCSRPLSEQLPQEMISGLVQVDQRIAALQTRYKNTLGAYLSIPSVPEEQISPDLGHAEILQNPEETLTELAIRFGSKDDPRTSNLMNKRSELGVFTNGITPEEKSMVAQRFRFARDVKLLGLGAEILNQLQVTPDKQGIIQLPSGTIIEINSDNESHHQDLLNPHLWEMRRQIKDRVYEILVNGRKYILKERKTDRHIATFNTGHRSGNSSKGEFIIAKDFVERGTQNEGHIGVHWERPVGVVTFPEKDSSEGSFQFVVFEYEEDLMTSSDARRSLMNNIISHQQQFEPEYKKVVQLLKKYFPRTELSFNDYAFVKAIRMVEQANLALHEKMTTMGYENTDVKTGEQDHFFKVGNDHSGLVQLSVFGFDFEYFHRAGNLVETHKRYVDSLADFENSERKRVNSITPEQQKEIQNLISLIKFAIIDSEK